jgi:acyl-CoA dehydrogenase
MTDLILSEESKQYQDLARDFFQNEVAGKSEKLDHDASFPMDLYKAAWELGLATTFIPERFGGLGLSLWDSTVMAEEEGAASGGLAAVFEANALAIAPVLLFGTESQQKKYLSILTAGPTLASICIPAKSGAATYPDECAVFTREGSSFVLNAENVIALNGEHASWFVIVAREDETNELSAFVFDGNLPGITRGAQIPKLGRKCADICRLKISNLELKEENRIGKQGEGQKIILESSCLSAPIVAAHAAGLMRCGLEHCIRYSKERQTFGKPIGKHQAIGFMMADMAKNAECARLMSWKAASLFDSDVRDYNLALSAKIFAVDAAMTSATDAVQVYGGYGYSKEYPVERLMRDAKMMQMMAGNSFELKCGIAEELLASTR